MVRDQRPGFRRRFRVSTTPGAVRSAVEDDYHCMAVTIRHDGTVAQAVEATMERVPWTTCPGAVAVLERTFTGVPLAEFAVRGEKRQNCTHLHDLATLAAAHATDADQLVFDILVSDPVDGRRHIELRRNQIPLLAWTDVQGSLVEPAELSGMRLDKMRTWIDTLDPMRREAARLLQWGAIIAHGRVKPMDKQSDARTMPVGMCYTFQSERVDSAKRFGVIRDFSTGTAQPLERVI